MHSRRVASRCTAPLKPLRAREYRGDEMRRSALVLICLALPASAAARPLSVTWLRGFAAPGTPAKYNKVGVIKVGSAKAKNVLVFEPGTSAGSAYFVPLAKWIISKAPDWQVWSVERRQNLLEDQSLVNFSKQGKVNDVQVYDYYFGSSAPHFHAVDPSKVTFAKQWGMNVAIQDLRRVITAARKLGGRVVLGGHSLGGSVVTAYATWNFGGRPGARDLAGLVYDDGGSLPAESAAIATAALHDLQAAPSPWLSFGGIPAPLAGVFNVTGSTAALLFPDRRNLGQSTGLLNVVSFPDGRKLTPDVPVSNLGQYGYALNVATSPHALIAAQAHLGRGITASGPIHGWDGRGALTPIKRFATMFSGLGMNDVDGTEWYFPQRLTDDTRAVNNGLPTAAQTVLDVHSTLGKRLPKTLRIYAFGAALGGAGVLEDAKLLAQQSGIPKRNLTLINRQGTYAHNDPAGAYPNNVFFDRLIPFLRKISG
jgi:pimeloyl-ACP methyl ester carboxylesterase